MERGGSLMNLEQQLAWWQEATGLTVPAEVPVGVTVTIQEPNGRRLEIVSHTDRFKADIFNMRRARKRPVPPGVKYATLPGRTTDDKLRRAYRDAMQRGGW
jgi:hypothetical protein